MPPKPQPYVPPPIDLGLFHWGSDLSEAQKIEITKWYRSLDAESRRFVDVLRDEQRQYTEFVMSYDG